jgi:hypothetical protein
VKPKIDQLPAQKARRAVVTDARPSALACLDAAMVNAVMSVAERVHRGGGGLLPANPQFAQQLDTVLSAAKTDMELGADPAAIRDFLTLFAKRRNLPVPSSLALDLDAATMAQWPQDLFAKAARQVWEHFAEMRLPNPPDFRAFIADDLAARHEEIAGLHTLQKRLETVANRGGEQIPAETFGEE